MPSLLPSPWLLDPIDVVQAEETPVIPGSPVVTAVLVPGGDRQTHTRRALLNCGLGLAFGAGMTVPRPSVTPTATAVALPLPADAESEPIDSAKALAKRLRATPFSESNVEATIVALARAGIPVYDDPTAAEPVRPVAGVPAPLRFLRWQVRNMALELARFGGQVGSGLDDLIPPPEGAPPPSLLLAGYVATAATPGGDLARAIMGDRDWREAATVTFPAMVLALCCADLARETTKSTRKTTRQIGAKAPGLGVHAFVPPAAGLCSTVQGFVDQTLDAVVAALTVEPPDDVPGQIIGSIWNFIVSVGEHVVKGLVKTLTKPVLQVIQSIAAVVGIGSLVLSALQSWAVSVEPDPDVTLFGVAAGNAGGIAISVDNGGLADWPPDIADCAAVAGVPLPPLVPKAAPLSWTVAETPIDLVAIIDQPALLGDDGRATLTYLTNTEDGATAAGTPVNGTLTVAVTVDRPDLDQLKNVIANAAFASLPDIVQKVLVPILGSHVKGLLGGFVKLASVSNTAAVTVIYHEREQTPEPESEDEDDAGAYQVEFTAPGPVEGQKLIFSVHACDGLDGVWSGIFRVVMPPIGVDDVYEMDWDFAGAETATTAVKVNTLGLAATWEFTISLDRAAKAINIDGVSNSGAGSEPIGGVYSGIGTWIPVEPYDGC